MDRRFPDGSLAIADRRKSGDRRLRDHLLCDWRYAYRGRRQAPRRLAATESSFVDLYEPALLVAAIALVVLSTADAVFTLALLEAGVAEEANPLMRWLIEHDIRVFINIKVVITAAAAVFLVVCSNAVVLRRIRGRTVMHAVLALYSAIVAYEVVLLRVSGLI